MALSVSGFPEPSRQTEVYIAGEDGYAKTTLMSSPRLRGLFGASGSGGGNVGSKKPATTTTTSTTSKADETENTTTPPTTPGLTFPSSSFEPLSQQEYELEFQLSSSSSKRPRLPSLPRRTSPSPVRLGPSLTRFDMWSRSPTTLHSNPKPTLPGEGARPLPTVPGQTITLPKQHVNAIAGPSKHVNAIAGPSKHPTSKVLLTQNSPSSLSMRYQPLVAGTSAEPSASASSKDGPSSVRPLPRIPPPLADADPVPAPAAPAAPAAPIAGPSRFVPPPAKVKRPKTSPSAIHPSTTPMTQHRSPFDNISASASGSCASPSTPPLPISSGLKTPRSRSHSRPTPPPPPPRPRRDRSLDSYYSGSPRTPVVLSHGARPLPQHPSTMDVDSALKIQTTPAPSTSNTHPSRPTPAVQPTRLRRDRSLDSYYAPKSRSASIPVLAAPPLPEHAATRDVGPSSKVLSIQTTPASSRSNTRPAKTRSSSIPPPLNHARTPRSLPSPTILGARPPPQKAATMESLKIQTTLSRSNTRTRVTSPVGKRSLQPRATRTTPATPRSLPIPHSMSAPPTRPPSPKVPDETQSVEAPLHSHPDAFSSFVDNDSVHHPNDNNIVAESPIEVFIDNLHRSAYSRSPSPIRYARPDSHDLDEDDMEFTVAVSGDDTSSSRSASPDDNARRRRRTEQLRSYRNSYRPKAGADGSLPWIPYRSVSPPEAPALPKVEKEKKTKKDEKKKKTKKNKNPSLSSSTPNTPRASSPERKSRSRQPRKIGLAEAVSLALEEVMMVRGRAGAPGSGSSPTRKKGKLAPAPPPVPPNASTGSTGALVLNANSNDQEVLDIREIPDYTEVLDICLPPPALPPPESSSSSSSSSMRTRKDTITTISTGSSASRSSSMKDSDMPFMWVSASKPPVTPAPFIPPPPPPASSRHQLYQQQQQQQQHTLDSMEGSGSSERVALVCGLPIAALGGKQLRGMDNVDGVSSTSFGSVSSRVSFGRAKTGKDKGKGKEKERKRTTSLGAGNAIGSSFRASSFHDDDDEQQPYTLHIQRMDTDVNDDVNNFNTNTNNNANPIASSSNTNTHTNAIPDASDDVEVDCDTPTTTTAGAGGGGVVGWPHDHDRNPSTEDDQVMTTTTTRIIHGTTADDSDASGDRDLWEQHHHHDQGEQEMGGNAYVRDVRDVIPHLRNLKVGLGDLMK